jgi:hypothetical protein
MSIHTFEKLPKQPSKLSLIVNPFEVSSSLNANHPK